MAALKLDYVESLLKNTGGVISTADAAAMEKSLFNIQITIKQQNLLDVLSFLMSSVKAHNKEIDDIHKFYARKEYVHMECNKTKDQMVEYVEGRVQEVKNHIGDLQKSQSDLVDKINSTNDELQKNVFEIKSKIKDVEKDMNEKFNDAIDMTNKVKRDLKKVETQQELEIEKLSNLHDLFQIDAKKLSRVYSIKSPSTTTRPRSGSTAFSQQQQQQHQLQASSQSIIVPSNSADSISSTSDDVEKTRKNVQYLYQIPVFTSLIGNLNTKASNDDLNKVSSDLTEHITNYNAFKERVKTQIEESVVEYSKREVTKQVGPFKEEVRTALGTKADADFVNKELSQKASIEQLKDKADHDYMLRLYEKLDSDTKGKLKDIEDWSKVISDELDDKVSRPEFEKLANKLMLAEELEAVDNVASARYRCISCGAAEPKYGRLKNIPDHLMQRVKEKQERAASRSRSSSSHSTSVHSSLRNSGGTSREPTSPKRLLDQTRNNIIPILGTDGTVYKGSKEFVAGATSSEDESSPSGEAKEVNFVAKSIDSSINPIPPETPRTADVTHRKKGIVVRPMSAEKNKAKKTAGSTEQTTSLLDYLDKPISSFVTDT